MRDAEAERYSLRAQLGAIAEPVALDIRSTIATATANFARMVDALPANLNDPEVVYEAREALREWLGEIRIEPTEDGPMAFWRINDEGLLLTAGPRVAKMVAGAGFEPATFGL